VAQSSHGPSPSYTTAWDAYFSAVGRFASNEGQTLEYRGRDGQIASTPIWVPYVTFSPNSTRAARISGCSTVSGVGSVA
jgi:hypothetical protein